MREAPDIVADLLRRVAAIGSIPSEALAKVEAETRAQYGGETVYIQKTALTRGSLARRNAAIREDHSGGASIVRLAQRHKLTTRRIQQILRSMGELT